MNKPRIAYDAYHTPGWVVDQAIRYVVPLVCPVPARILDPGAGDGAFVKRLRQRYFGAHITAIDITPHDWPDATVSVHGDFMTTDLDRYDLAIGNPPFSHAKYFITRCLAVSRATVMLVRQGFLSSRRRNAFWRLHRPSDVFILAHRPSFTPDGLMDQHDYCFVCWGRPAHHDGVTRLHWLPLVPLSERK